MASEHQRPLAAYFLLCIAVAFLLTQGVLSSTTTTFDRVVSRAGQPAALLFQSTTLTVLDTVGLVPEREAVAPIFSTPATSTPAAVPTRTRHAHQGAQTGHPRPPQAQGGAKAKHPGKSKHATVRTARAASPAKAHGKGHGHRKHR